VVHRIRIDNDARPARMCVGLRLRLCLKKESAWASRTNTAAGHADSVEPAIAYTIGRYSYSYPYLQRYHPHLRSLALMPVAPTLMLVLHQLQSRCSNVERSTCVASQRKPTQRNARQQAVSDLLALARQATRYVCFYDSQQCSAVQCSAAQRSAAQRSAAQHSTAQHSLAEAGEGRAGLG
jgi:hypothetical protein